MTCRRLLFGLLAGGALLGAFVVAGGYNVSAAAGHLPPVAALLHWTMQNSVSVRAGGAPPADLDGEARIRAGAGHYDLVCRDCHGAPGAALTALARSLEPPPPHILDAVGHWQAEELFWIVKHGIKMTAMPAWPAQERDDEVWSMVAFLRRLPELEPEEYRRMTRGPADGERPRPVRDDFDAELERCARCHGYDGRGARAAGLPRLGGQSEPYLLASLEAFARGERASGIMRMQASAAERRHWPALARHYAAAEVGADGPAGRAEGAVELIHAGRRLAQHGDPERLIPACAACHGPARYPRAERYPRIAGQPADYLRTQLELFRRGVRGGSDLSPIMQMAARRLEPRDIAALARYYESLPAAGPAEAAVTAASAALDDAQSGAIDWATPR
ncbi:MAG TPA: c-type cytochrome [Pseudomonadales bacterium]